MPAPWPEGVRPLHVGMPDPAQFERLHEFARRLTAEHIRLRFAGLRKLERADEIAEAFQCGWAGHEMVSAMECDGALVGVANCAGLGRPRLDTALVVRPDRTRRGIGYALLEAVKRWGRDRDFATLHGTILWDNRPMRLLARKAGFLSVGVSGIVTDVERSLR
jgi:GNAT superfamily N-acetyltransferase